MAEREVVYKDAETGFTVVKDMEEPGGGSVPDYGTGG